MELLRLFVFLALCTQVLALHRNVSYLSYNSTVIRQPYVTVLMKIGKVGVPTPYCTSTTYSSQICDNFCIKKTQTKFCSGPADYCKQYGCGSLGTVCACKFVNATSVTLINDILTPGNTTTIYKSERDFSFALPLSLVFPRVEISLPFWSRPDGHFSRRKLLSTQMQCSLSGNVLDCETRSVDDVMLRLALNSLRFADTLKGKTQYSLVLPDSFRKESGNLQVTLVDTTTLQVYNEAFGLVGTPDPPSGNPFSDETWRRFGELSLAYKAMLTSLLILVFSAVLYLLAGAYSRFSTPSFSYQQLKEVPMIVNNMAPARSNMLLYLIILGLSITLVVVVRADAFDGASCRTSGVISGSSIVCIGNSNCSAVFTSEISLPYPSTSSCLTITSGSTTASLLIKYQSLSTYGRYKYVYSTCDWSANGASFQSCAGSHDPIAAICASGDLGDDAVDPTGLFLLMGTKFANYPGKTVYAAGCAGTSCGPCSSTDPSCLLGRYYFECMSPSYSVYSLYGTETYASFTVLYQDNEGERVYQFDSVRAGASISVGPFVLSVKGFLSDLSVVSPPSFVMSSDVSPSPEKFFLLETASQPGAPSSGIPGDVQFPANTDFTVATNRHKFLFSRDLVSVNGIGTQRLSFSISKSALAADRLLSFKSLATSPIYNGISWFPNATVGTGGASIVTHNAVASPVLFSLSSPHGLTLSSKVSYVCPTFLPLAGSDSVSAAGCYSCSGGAFLRVQLASVGAGCEAGLVRLELLDSSKSVDRLAYLPVSSVRLTTAYVTFSFVVMTSRKSLIGYYLRISSDVSSIDVRITDVYLTAPEVPFDINTATTTISQSFPIGGGGSSSSSSFSDGIESIADGVHDVMSTTVGELSNVFGLSSIFGSNSIIGGLMIIAMFGLLAFAAFKMYERIAATRVLTKKNM